MSQLDDDIATLLERHTPAIRRLATEVIATVREVRSDLTPKVQRGWGSVNFRHPAAGFVCGVFPQAREANVILVFEHGRLLDSPLLVDNGKVRQVRWIPFAPGDTIPVDEIAILLAEAIALRA
ncbi:MAG TPA: hypothetical protein PK286_15075 [Devosia sp.]|nr:hypothetical protein [Devosia sp.]